MSDRGTMERSASMSMSVKGGGNKRRHHRDSTIENIRKTLQTDTDTAAVAQTMRAIGTLLDFITTNRSQLEGHSEEVRNMETLTTDLLVKVQDDSVLTLIVKEAGWVGSRYQFSEDITVDVETMYSVLSNLYMSKSQVEFSDDSVIKSFCPESLVTCDEINLLNNLRASGMKEATIVPFYGTCMLVDISGFTKLSAMLCTQGSSGLDDLHAAISGYLGRCVEIVYAYGGDGKYYNCDGYIWTVYCFSYFGCC